MYLTKYYWGDQIEERWAGYVVRMRERRHVYKFLVEKPEEKRLLEKRRCRWKDNTKVDLQEVGWGMDWIDMV